MTLVDLSKKETIADVRKALHNAYLNAGNQAKLSDKQLAESIKAGWIALDAKYCPDGKKSATCPFPGTKVAAFKAIDKVLKDANPKLRRERIVHVSNVDDGTMSKKTQEAIELFKVAVVKRMATFKAINACKAGGRVFNLETNVCLPAEAEKDDNMIMYIIGGAALLFLLMRK